MRDGVGGGEQVECSNTRSHQRLMSVTESRVGNQQVFFFSRPVSEFLWSKSLQELAGACWRLPGGRCRHDCCFDLLRNLLPFYFGVAVEDDIAEIGKQF